MIYAKKCVTLRPITDALYMHIEMERKQWLHIIEWTVAIAALVYLVYSLATYDHYDLVSSSLKAMGWQQWTALALCVALMPINMLLEAWKWAFLMNKCIETEERLSLFEAQHQVYYGKLAGLITPWRLGEYPARGLMMPKGKRRHMPKVLSMGAVGSATMTLAIVIAGVIALFFSPAVTSLLGDSYLLAVVAVVFALAICLLLAPKALRKWAKINNRTLIVGVALSLLRLFCWCIQFGLILFSLDSLSFSVESIGLIPVYYLLITITPNVPIVEVGVRGAWAMLLFGSANAALAGVLLWAINTLLPCLAASVKQMYILRK